MKYTVNKGQIARDIVPFKKGQKYKITEHLVGLDGSTMDRVYEVQILSIFKNGKVRTKNLTYGYEYKIIPEKSNKEKIYELLED